MSSFEDEQPDRPAFLAVASQKRSAVDGASRSIRSSRSNRVASRLVAPRLASRRRASSRLAAPRLASPRLVSSCLASARHTSPRSRLVLPRPVSPRLVSPRFASSRLAASCLVSSRLVSSLVAARLVHTVENASFLRRPPLLLTLSSSCDLTTCHDRCVRRRRRECVPPRGARGSVPSSSSFFLRSS